MNNYFTITMYFRVLDSSMFGGEGSQGYCYNELDFSNNEAKGGALNAIDGVREIFAKWMKVPIENIISIDRLEYLKNVEEVKGD